MDNKRIVGIILIGIALVFGYIGYQKSQPILVEGIVKNIAIFAPTDQERERYNRNINKQFSSYKRGIPFYVAGILLGIIGGIVLAGNNK